VHQRGERREHGGQQDRGEAGLHARQDRNAGRDVVINAGRLRAIAKRTTLRARRERRRKGQCPGRARRHKRGATRLFALHPDQEGRRQVNFCSAG
jgi:hypothetical protein